MIRARILRAVAVCLWPAGDAARFVGARLGAALIRLADQAWKAAGK